MDTDFKTPPPDTLLIFTDYAASMALRAIEKVNSSVNAHAVNDNFVCISNRRKAIYTEKRKEDNGDVSENEESKEIFTCDVFHIIAETLSKVKKNDHQMHNVALDEIVTQ